MENWLKLTELDIEEANRPSDYLRVHRRDLSAEPAYVVETAVIRITYDDLATSLPNDPNTHTLEKQMWQLINQARQTYTMPRLLGTSKLKWHEGLAIVARAHSGDMLNRHYVEHMTPEGMTAVQRIRRAGIGYLACGENIGVVYGMNSHSVSGIHDIHQAFMNQPRGRVNNHRGNLLNPFWTHVGVGVMYSANGALFATQNFISTLGQ